MKHISYLILSCLIVALGLWCKTRWKVWFKNVPEDAYAPLATPGRVLLTFGEDEDTRYVSWQCDSVVHPSYVELTKNDSDTVRIEAEGEVFISRNGQAAYYIARLANLDTDTQYVYRVVTQGKTSEWFSFRTYPHGDRAFAFLYVGDVQDTIQGMTNTFLRQALNRHPQCEFTVCGGDFIERPIDKYWGEGFRNLDSIGQHMPFLTVTGNHDYFKGIIQRFERRFDLVFPYFLHSAVNENQVYTLCYGDAQFFLLDSNRRPHKLWEQRKWLREQLSHSQARWKIVVLHHPLFSIKGGNNLIQRYMFNDLVEEYGVDLVLQGHEHAYARMTRHLDDETATTPVYTISHCSPKNYRIQFDKRFDKFGISSRYYQIIALQDSVMTVSAYDAYSHSVYDSLRIIKSEKTRQIRIEDMGAQIPEYLEYTPKPGNKKDQKFAKRIHHYRNWRQASSIHGATCSKNMR